MEPQNYFIEKNKEFNSKFELEDLNLAKYYTGRTSYQLEHFVQNEHDTPERKCLQLIMELKALRDGYIYDSIEIEKTKIEIERLLATGDPIDKLEAIKKEYKLCGMYESMEYRNREVKTLAKLLKQLPKIYTYEEIEAGEQKYWEKRLSRQCMEDMLSRATGVNPGNIRSAILTEYNLGKKFLELQYGMLGNLKDSEIHQLPYQ